MTPGVQAALVLALEFELFVILLSNGFHLPYLNRFLSADTIVPDPTSPQSLNRFSYVRNNPVNRIDPSGHIDCGSLGDSADVQGCNESKPNDAILARNVTSIVATDPLSESVVPDGWRHVEVNYRKEFGKYASDTAPHGTIHIYYQYIVENMDELSEFEIVARIILNENMRGLLYDDPRFANEVGEHWPQDQIAPAFVLFHKSRNDNISASTLSGSFAARALLSPNNTIATDRAHIVALGVDEGWLNDPTFGADWFFHSDKNPSFDGNTYLDDTYAGNWDAGTWWQPSLNSSRIVMPFGEKSAKRSPYR
ncbi:MAG: hypothetical protein GY943_19790 [Chloroflexi bacterium]|nr:hypothetical protein [Chloroflexota bacterium]